MQQLPFLKTLHSNNDNVFKACVVTELYSLKICTAYLSVFTLYLLQVKAKICRKKNVDFINLKSTF